MADLDAMNELHWLIDMVQTIEVGLVVLDRDYNIQLWNGFMENHSGISPNDIKGDNLFKRFPDLPADWLKQKMETVFTLKNQAFISYEQRPYVFQFSNYHPITGQSRYMYQNLTLLPLTSLTGKVSHISIIVYDVTSMAMTKRQLIKAKSSIDQLQSADELTGMMNRRHWLQALEQEFKRCQRYQSNACLVLFNLDNFAQINHDVGFDCGDKILASVAHKLSLSVRDTDCLGRYDGNTFAVILPNTPQDQAEVFCKRFLQKLATHPFKLDGHSILLTSSAAVVEFGPDYDLAQHWLLKAEQQLKLAKSNGGNVCHSAES
ncbi:diguanylate cyclase [Shewanella sp. NIFS-20-20]|uniref:sensor domain-containing diguanylate cyclase n=1 Tax=Shewanella sp. NIFS-20-20 TaxID=2853806 RepID=UPI001C480154|nr:diguanylate cyclase [Shewanella sp. NIFS-20-20]MBV7316203.1 diguanylate cyclase [Shewanella sp. NIFS-20-20]